MHSRRSQHNARHRIAQHIVRDAAHVARLLRDQRFLVIRIVDQRELDISQIFGFQRSLRNRTVNGRIGHGDLAALGRRTLRWHPKAGQLLLLAIGHIGDGRTGTCGQYSSILCKCLRRGHRAIANLLVLASSALVMFCSVLMNRCSFLRCATASTSASSCCSIFRWRSYSFSLRLYSFFFVMMYCRMASLSNRKPSLLAMRVETDAVRLLSNICVLGRWYLRDDRIATRLQRQRTAVETLDRILADAPMIGAVAGLFGVLFLLVVCVDRTGRTVSRVTRHLGVFVRIVLFNSILTTQVVYKQSVFFYASISTKNNSDMKLSCLHCIVDT